MALKKEGGSNPYAGQEWTSTGPKGRRPKECWKCRERKDGLMTVDPNGQLICAECSGAYGRGILTPQEDSQYDVGPSD